jgi:hypothetical protein
MQLDAAVESALNVLPSNTDAASSFSLYGLLNKAYTPMGKALLKVRRRCRKTCDPPPSWDASNGSTHLTLSSPQPAQWLPRRAEVPSPAGLHAGVAEAAAD